MLDHNNIDINSIKEEENTNKFPILVLPIESLTLDHPPCRVYWMDEMPKGYF